MPTPGWHTSGALLAARTHHTATRLFIGKVLVAGGYDNGSRHALAAAELYDPATGTWSATGSMAHPRLQHTATLLPDGTVLVIGGHDGTGIYGGYPASAERYDPATGTWSAAGNLAQPRARHTATLLLDGTVLVVGGDTFNPSFASVEQYDPATNTWSARSGLPMSRTQHSATLLPDGRVLVVSGMSYPTPWQMLPQTSALLYDPSTDTWHDAGSPKELHRDHTATLLPDGTVLIAGGEGGVGIVQETVATEIYNPVLGTWRHTGSLTTARSGHAAALLPNGDVLVVGGTGASGLASAELYNPEAGTWAPAGSMSTAQGWHTATATLLSDGNVLVVGIGPAEIYGLYHVMLPLLARGGIT